MKPILIGGLLIIVIAFAIFAATAAPAPDAATLSPKMQVQLLKVGTVLVAVDVARSPREQRQGLAGKTALSDTEGMLFPFAKASEQTFWNKGMVMPFDLIWLYDGQVVGIEKNLPKETAGLRTVRAPTKVSAVLEMNAGWADRHGLKIGDGIVDQ